MNTDDETKVKCLLAHLVEVRNAINKLTNGEIEVRNSYCTVHKWGSVIDSIDTDPNTLILEMKGLASTEILSCHYGSGSGFKRDITETLKSIMPSSFKESM